MSRKKQEKLLSEQIQDIWKKYVFFLPHSNLMMKNVLLGLRKDHSMTQFSLLISSTAGQVTQIDLGVFNRDYFFKIQNKNYKVSRKTSFRSVVILTDEQENEVMKFESIGMFGLKHHFFNRQYDFKSQHFWAMMSSGYKYDLDNRQVGFCHPLYGNKNYGQLLVLDDKIPLEFRVFILVVNWMGL